MEFEYTYILKVYLKIRRSCDVWSLGCILYQMVYGRSPFQKLPLSQKIAAITNDQVVIDFPKIEFL